MEQESNNNISKKNNNYIQSSEIKEKQQQKEPSVLSLAKLNSIAKSYGFKQIPYQICEICFHPLNLIICSFCKNQYHPKCLHLVQIPSLFICHMCKGKFSTVNTLAKSSMFDESNQSAKKDKSEASSSSLNSKRRRDEPRSKKKESNSSTSHPPLPTSHRKKGNLSDLLKKERETRILLSYEHSNPQYKRRKIKIGINHNVDMYEFTDRYENQINFEDDEYERKQLKQVWSCSNPLSPEEISSYVKTARLFWNYRNMFLENELCSDFFEECERLMKGKKMSEKLKERIHKLMTELKGLVRRGVDLNCHYDEMALKMLHICKYKVKVALLFLYKQLNPFVEEAEEGFKNDVFFFQSEIVSIINDGDFDIDE